MLTLDTCIFKNDQVPWRIIENEAILVDVGQGNVMQLNEVGAFIWSQIDGKKTMGQVIDCVYDSFEIDKAQAQQDTLEFLKELLKKQIIKLR